MSTPTNDSSSDRPNEGRNGGERNMKAVILAVIALILVIGGVVWIANAITSTPPSPGQAVELPSPSNTTAVPMIGGYELHYYSRDKGVAAGYYGPGCVPTKTTGDPTVADMERCKADLLDRVKHDPILASSIAQDLNLLPGVASTMTPAQIEVFRKAYADKLAKDGNLRKKVSADIATVLGTMKDLKMVRLDGWYRTTVVNTKTGAISTITVKMDPKKKVALTGTTPDGVTHTFKTDCGHQPTVPATPPPAVCPPGSTSSQCVPCPPGSIKPGCKPKPPTCTSGKCSPNGPPVMTDPSVPPVVQGPNPTGKHPQPGPGNPNPGPSGCAGPCPTASQRPTPAPTTTPPPGYTAPPVDPGSGAPAPTTSETAPPPPPPAG